MKKLRLIIVFLAICFILQALPSPTLAQSVGITNAQSNRTFVPIRYLSEQFGYLVYWFPEDQSIKVQDKNNVVKLTIGRKHVYLNNELIPNDAIPYIQKGVTYVPLGIVAKALGISIDWDAAVSGIRIHKGDKIILLPVVSEKRWNEIVNYPVQSLASSYTIDKRIMKANLIKIDLLNPLVDLEIGLAEGGIGSVAKLDKIAKSNGATVAINGTFFDAYTDADLKNPYGYIIKDGVIAYKASGDIRTVLIYDKLNQLEIIPGNSLLQRIQNGDIEGALQVGPRLITDGKITVNPIEEGFKDPKILTNAGARSALGLTKDYKLILLTTSGATIPQLANMMLQAGAVQAMNLDGGASSGLYLDGKYITTPGRDISNALLITVNE